MERSEHKVLSEFIPHHFLDMYYVYVLQSKTDKGLYIGYTKDLKKRIEGRDLVAQLDKRICGYPMICTGIMCIRPSDKTKRMFEWMLKHIERFGNDQKAINHYLLYGRIKWTTLPKTYYSINYDNGNKVWDGRDLKLKTRPYYAFHLNWTIGIENKLRLWELLDYKRRCLPF